jgi:GH15 family glucan-1,4-alpha-glucosidase
MASPRPNIGDYALIGDCRSAALISSSGSIDWLCWPRFDSPSLFGALLDPEKGGRFAIRPTRPCTTTRRYVGDSNVLQTTFRTDRGTLRLTDLMPVESEAGKRNKLWAAHQILRTVECLDGEVEVEVICDPRPDYGRHVPRLRDRGTLGLNYERRGRALIVRSEMPLELSADQSQACMRHVLKAGERRHVSVVYTEREPSFIPPLGEEAERRTRSTLAWWHDWAARCRYEGPFRDAVIRSALALKLLAYAPSGAVVAAPTTSLPEWPGGVRNWDYRYCWLRDASLTLQSLLGLGYEEEAMAYMSWLLHATRLTWPELQVLYDVHGETHLPERELDHLAGHANSRPVRIGNDACHQLQLDIYGEVIDAAYVYARHNGGIDSSTARMLVGLGRTVCRRWREPDEGIWEARGGRRHHTYSKVMCWVALDRLLKLHESGTLSAPVSLFARERAAIRQQVEQHGYSEPLQSYVSVLGGDSLDASLLLLTRYGYAAPDSPRAIHTCRQIRRRLGRRGLLYRYLSDDDGLPPGEGAFGICSFWGAECSALQGNIEDAENMFRQVVAHANDLGLLAEEIDPDTGEALGNFPQAFTHVGLIDAALTIERVRHGREVMRAGAATEARP